MALFRKLGGVLRQTASRNLLSETCVTKPSILQAIRCMSSMASSKLFVGGLSYATDDFQLKEAFTKYGEVIEARVIVDRETGRSRGFGFVTFTSSEEASSAIQAMDGQALYGRNVRVNYATERARGGFGGGGGYGGNFGGPGGAYGDSYGGSNYGPGGGNYSPPGGNYGPPGGSYGPPGGSYGPSGGNYGPPGGDFSPSGGSYGPPGGDYAPSGGVGGGNYGSSPDFGTGSQYTGGGSTYGNVAGGGGGGSASFGGSSAGSGFEGSPDFGFGSGDKMDTDVTDKIDESTGDFEEGDVVDGNYRDDDDDGDFAKRA